MKKLITFILLIMLLSQSAIFAVGNNKQILSDENLELDILDKGFIDEKDGVTFVYLNGSNYEMGYQHGFLLKEKILQNYRAFLNFAEEFYEYEKQDFIDLWYNISKYIPQQYKEEMKGVSDALNMPFIDIAIGTVMTFFVHCSGITAWGPATLDGRLYYTRSLDFPLIIQDPISEKYIQENAVIFIRKPDNGYMSFDPSYAGFIGCFDGVNEKGVAIQVLTSKSDDEYYGNPAVIRIRMILDNAESADEALEILNDNMTCGWNFILADWKEPIGYAIEQTHNISYVGQWDSQGEKNYPFYSIPYVLRRSNLFVNPETSETQRDNFNPRFMPIISIINGRNLLPSGFPSYMFWAAYQALSNGIYGIWGEINLVNSMEMIRNYYNGHGHIVYYLMKLIGFGGNLQLWVCCPETGDLLISFADKLNNANKEPIHNFNIYSLMNEH